MKKFTSLVLVLALSLALCVSVFAAAENSDGSFSNSDEISMAVECEDTDIPAYKCANTELKQISNHIYAALDENGEIFAYCGEEPPEITKKEVSMEAESEDMDIPDYKCIDTELKQISDHVYAVLDENGEIFAYYGEEHLETTQKAVQPRVSWPINWTIIAGKTVAGQNQITGYSGLTYEYNKIGLFCRDNNVFYAVHTLSDNKGGWFTLARDMGIVSFAIQNQSDNTITYSGSYQIYS